MDINKYNPTGILNKKHLISLYNYSEEEIYEILYKAKELETRLSVGEKLTTLKNKYVSLLTKRSFARSRIAFETAVYKLSGTPMVSTMHGSELEIILKDKLSMEAVLGYGISAIVVQTQETTDAELLEKAVNIPIINANSKSGPCEVLSALLTVWRSKRRLSGLKVALIGNPNAYANSFIYAFTNCGFDVSIICPENMYPNEKIVNYCNQFSDATITDNMKEGLTGADVIFVSSDGQDENFILNSTNIAYAKQDAIVLHTLPVPENGGISEDIMPLVSRSILDEAHNLPLIEIAVMSLLI